MTSKHTPGPYFRDLTLLCAGAPNSLTKSAIVAEFKNAADASFAMRALNSHDDLLAASKAALHYMRLHKYADQAWADDLEAAIAKAEGK